MSIDKSQISNHKSELAAVKLPISKSIANRLLLLQAIHGDSLMRVSSDMPDDVIVLHDALQKIRDVYGVPGSLPSDGECPVDSRIEQDGVGLTLHLKNCGTALRFLQVHLEKCYPDAPVELTGEPRLMERAGKPTTQITSARILHGEDIPVAPDESPYITMSRRIKELYETTSLPSREGSGLGIESDWSAAAFWYEYVAIHGGELLLEGLKRDSLQGDKMVAQIYNRYFGVITSYFPEGVKISKSSVPVRDQVVAIDFENIPDLYPAIALTCERLKLTFQATGTSRLRFKESNRLRSVRTHEVNNDHRMAMALMASGAYPLPLPKGKGEEMQRIIAKSYPQFIENIYQITAESRRSADGQPTVKANVRTLLVSHITPRRGINDDNLGKKHALSKLIHAASTEYVWLHDDDIEWPSAAQKANLTFPVGKENLDLVILPLRMESSFQGGEDGSGPSLLEKLQIAEYAAIQELTMQSAKKEQACMCSGANLIVKREVWLACEPDLHPEIPSGDDMFLLEAAKRRGYKIGVIDEPDYTAVVRPVTSWRAFLHQRMRWAGKAPKYTDKDIIRYGAFVAAANILQILCPLIILIKFPIEYSLIKKREPRTPWYVALLLEIFYPIYMLVAFFGGLLRTKQW